MRFLYIIYQICIGLPIFLVATILTALTTMLGCWLGNGHFWGYYPGKLWSQLTCFLFLLPVKVKGHEHLDKKTSYVFVANHQGSFLRKLPFVGKACESAGFIFVDKSSPRKVYETIKSAEKVLQGGTSLVVFPEGARTFTGHMANFKKGAFLLADQLQLPVVPLTIDGSFDILPRTGKLLHWHPMTLTIHEPIYPLGKKGEENLQMLMAESYKAIEKDLPQKYKGKMENPDQ